LELWVQYEAASFLARTALTCAARLAEDWEPYRPGSSLCVIPASTAAKAWFDTLKQ
jgi:hypothetical protein